MFEIITPERFLRRAQKFLKQHPDLEKKFERLLEALRMDPFQPALRLHILSGKLRGFYAVSLTYQYRITLTLQVSAKSITLIDIGSHDEVY